ncbi:MAG TPA: winged helix-turn-helix transcriptional regulator, partial [Solirubrobacterales bacterium]|nr:winged helix-turn-helix transcriptional regulator [Solirubrobacterales bacterium]
EASALDKARSLIEDRIKELDDEKRRLEKALSGLKGGRRGPGRPRRSGSSARSSGGRPRRRRRGGTRAEHAMKAVQAQPGITASEIAKKLKIKPNYVYRVMADLTADGKVAKEGRGYTAT